MTNPIGSRKISEQRYHNPVDIRFGVGIFKKLSDILLDKRMSSETLLVLTGRQSFAQSGGLNELNKQLVGCSYSTYNRIPPNPDVQDVVRIKQETDRLNYNAVLALGGGSVIDVAKVLAAIKDIEVYNAKQLRNLITQRQYLGNDTGVKIIAVPTTAGTGSEVTCWATVWDQENAMKYSLESALLYPSISIVDPCLTTSLPKRMTAITALDALAHATDAYWAKSGSPIVKMYAKEAIRRIISNLPKLLESLTNLELRTQVAYGSLFAGLAFSNTKTTACHSISYPLTLLYDVPHGVGVSMTLGEVMKINEYHIEAVDELLDVYGISSVDEAGEVIKSIAQQADLSFRLRDFGVKEDDLREIVSLSFTRGRMDNNPVDLSEEVLLNVLRKLY